MSKHQAAACKNVRGKSKVEKICMNCGIEYDNYPSGVVNPYKKERGLCPKCKKYNRAIDVGDYGPEDWNQQSIGEV